MKLNLWPLKKRKTKIEQTLDNTATTINAATQVLNAIGGFSKSLGRVMTTIANILQNRKNGTTKSANRNYSGKKKFRRNKQTTTKERYPKTDQQSSVLTSVKYGNLSP